MRMKLFKSVFNYPCGCIIEVTSTDKSDILARLCNMHKNIDIGNYANVKQIENTLCLDHENSDIYSVEVWEKYIRLMDGGSSFYRLYFYRVYADGHIMSISPLMPISPSWRNYGGIFQLVKCSCGFNSKRFFTSYKPKDEPGCDRSRKDEFDDFHESLYKLAIFS